MERKYELTEETIYLGEGVILHRIRALRDFGSVKAGDLGGFIQKEDNLSHNGNCWVYDKAKVYNCARISDNAFAYGHVEIYNNAKVYCNAKVYGSAKVCDNAEVYGHVEIYNNAKVYGNAIVCDNAEVYGNVEVYGNAMVYDDARIYNNAKVYGSAEVCDIAKIYHNAIIRNPTDYIVIGPIGSRNDYTTFYKGKDNIIYVVCGCFNDTLDKFIEAVIKTHKNNEFYRRQYLSITLAVKNIMK